MMMWSASELQQEKVDEFKRFGIEAKPHRYLNCIILSAKGAETVLDCLRTLSETNNQGKEERIHGEDSSRVEVPAHR